MIYAIDADTDLLSICMMKGGKNAMCHAAEKGLTWVEAPISWPAYLKSGSDVTLASSVAFPTCLNCTVYLNFTATLLHHP